MIKLLCQAQLICRIVVAIKSMLLRWQTIAFRTTLTQPRIAQ
jgi:hypothetical protein